jgi:hypothetical protein
MAYRAQSLPQPRQYDPMTADELEARGEMLEKFGLGDSWMGDVNGAFKDFAGARESLRAAPKRMLGDAIDSAIGLDGAKGGSTKADLLGLAGGTKAGATSSC